MNFYARARYSLEKFRKVVRGQSWHPVFDVFPELQLLVRSIRILTTRVRAVFRFCRNAAFLAEFRDRRRAIEFDVRACCGSQ